MNNIIRLGLISIYPLLLLFSLMFVVKKYKQTIIDNYKHILMNTAVAVLVIAVALIIFFHFEDTIYAYDYAGHWIRSLTLREYFYEGPSRILPLVYNSMNNSDYSYLPALFSLPFILLNQSYLFFALTNLVIFLAPTFVLIQIVYFSKTKERQYLPLLVMISVFPFYLTLFYGKVDCCGLLFITLAYALIIVPDFEDIDYLDTLPINIFAFLAIFLRRWYLYSVICLYLSFFIKWLFYKNKNVKDLFLMISSGIILLIVCLLFFRPFIINSLTNNFSEAYAVYNHDGKVLSFINNISPIIIAISIVGLCVMIKEKKYENALINVVSIIIPCLMIWKIQSFEYHHYYIFLLNIVILFTYGLSFMHSKKTLATVISALLLIQPLMIFTNSGNTFVFTNIRKHPEVLEQKEELIDLSMYIKSIQPDETFTAFLSAGAYGIITDDLLRNALLPDIDFPNIDSAVFDLRDGFPKDYQYIKYIITVDPIIYTDKDYQHMFDIISDAVKNHELISTIYEPIKEVTIQNNFTVTVYERIGDYTPKMKKYFYTEMLKYYPDKKDYFDYILD